MPRPYTERWVGWSPVSTMFKPAGVPACKLKKQQITIDEVEAIRLVDGEGLDQQDAADRMKVSRATVGRILEVGRRKVAVALANGHALVIGDGQAGVRYYGSGSSSEQQPDEE